MAKRVNVDDSQRAPVQIGLNGENDAREIAYDITPWADLSGTANVMVKRSGDTDPYISAASVDGNSAVWTVSDADLVAGYGELQFIFTSGDTVVAKSPIFSTYVANSLSGDTVDPPDPVKSWYDEVIAAAGNVESTIGRAEAAAEEANAAVEKIGDSVEKAEAAAEAAESSASSIGTAVEDAQAAAQAAETAAQNAAGYLGTVQADSQAAQQAAANAAASDTAAAQSAQAAQSAAESTAGSVDAAAASAAAAAASAEQAATSAAGIGDQLTQAQTAASTATTKAEEAAQSAADAAKSADEAASAAGGGVVSFNGRNGAVSPQAGDYTADMVGAYNKEQVDALLGNVTVDLSGYATEEWVKGLGYITSAALTGYATRTWVGEQGFLKAIPPEYITEEELEAKGYLTAVPAEYITKEELEAKGYATTTALSGYVPTSRTVNGKALNTNVTLAAADVGAALPAQTTTVTLASGSWVSSGTRFSQTVSVSLVKADSVVVVDAALVGSDPDADAEVLAAWSGPAACNVDQAAGSLTFYSAAAPTVNIPVLIGVV